jgi:hypothetical protein
MTPLIQRSTFAKVLCKNCANSFMGIVALHSDFYYLVHSEKQSHSIEVAQGDIFMEQKLRFGLVTEKKWGLL